MYCNRCGTELSDPSRFCGHCGQPVATGLPTARPALQRSRTDRKIAGVCAGFAHHLDLDPTLVRLIWVVLAFVGGGGLLAYVVAWIVIPEEPLLVTTTAPSPTL